ALGGHSLMAVKLAAEIKERLGVSLELVEIFEAPSAAGLARRLRQRDALSVARLEHALPQASPAQRRRPSLTQESFWYMNQLKPASPVYNMPGAWLLEGPLALESLRLGLADLVRRHVALRLVFDTEAGHLEARATPASDLTLELCDLSACDEANA